MRYRPKFKLYRAPNNFRIMVNKNDHFFTNSCAMEDTERKDNSEKEEVSEIMYKAKHVETTPEAVNRNFRTLENLQGRDTCTCISILTLINVI